MSVSNDHFLKLIPSTVHNILTSPQHVSVCMSAWMSVYQVDIFYRQVGRFSHVERLFCHRKIFDSRVMN